MFVSTVNLVHEALMLSHHRPVIPILQANRQCVCVLILHSVPVFPGSSRNVSVCQRGVGVEGCCGG